MMLYQDMNVMVCSPDSDTDYFDTVAGILQRDTLTLFLLIICLDYILWTSIDLMKGNGFILKKARSGWYPVETITDANYIDDLALLANTPPQAESLFDEASGKKLWSLLIYKGTIKNTETDAKTF